MDKELPTSHFQVKTGKVFVKLSRQTMPNGELFYRGSIPYRHTLTMEDIATRIVDRGSYLKRETLLSAYRTLIDEIYNAFENGYNVDFDLGRTELTVSGCFDGPNATFDRRKHHLGVSLRPSMRLNQIPDFTPAETHAFNQNAPGPNEISISNEPYHKDCGHDFNVIPSGYPYPLFIHGRLLKIMGELPSVGITFHHVADGRELFFPASELIVNTPTLICLMPKAPLEAGVWKVDIASQYNRTYRLYRKERHGYVTLTVL